jgi:hypothetical protein
VSTLLAMHQKKKLILSILCSFFLHLLSIHLTQRYSLWFSSSSSPPSLEGSIEKSSRDQILKETFAQGPARHSSPLFKPLHESTLLSFQPFSITETALAISSFPLQAINPPPFPQELLLSSSQNIAFKVPVEEGLNLFEHLPKNLIIPAPPLPTHALLLPQRIEGESLVFESLPMPQPTPPSPSTITYETTLLSPPSLNETTHPPKNQLFTPNPHLPDFPSLSELETASYSDAFDTEILFLPREDEKGYLFAVTLIPRPHLQALKIKQNYSFLIDRSNSIQKERLVAAKNAIYKALDELDGDDTFNIIAFDSKIERLSPTSLPYSEESLQTAKAFLDRIELGSFFSSAQLLKPLFLTIPSTIKEDELHTAIVLTDGDLLHKKGAQKSLLYEWTANNAGRVALFAVGIGDDPYLSALETTAAFNKGTMVYSPTKGSLKRKLLKLMKTISYPIAKNLSCRAITREAANQIELYPKQHFMPHLYFNEPYVILGTTKNLEDFILFVQGRLKNKWIHIKKKISFVHAKKGTTSLKAQWALQQAYDLYGKYLCDENPDHLLKARELLDPYHLQVAFQ